MRLKKLRLGEGDCASTLEVKRSASTKAVVIFMCACFSKRCKTCQTLYQSRMTRALAVAFITMMTTAVIFAKTKHCVVRVYAQANANDTDVFASPVTTPISGKTIFIEKIPTIAEQDIVAFRAYPGANGSFGALLQLDEHGRLALETLSIEHRGTALVVVVNGRTATELMVDRRVSDGRLYIASGLTAADLELMRKDWPQIGQKKRR